MSGSTMPVLDPQRRATLAKALRMAVDKRAQAVGDFPDWDAMRQRGHDIRARALERLDELLAQFERAAAANGVRVVRAATAAEACDYVIAVARRLGVTRAVKAKSMVTEEIHLNRAMEAAGIRPIETDLGEYIAQLNGQTPFHLTAPVIHLSRAEIGRVLSNHLGVAFTDDPAQLTLLAREALRREFLGARLGISGANFLVAETGSIVLVTNEGNGRLCTTLPAADGPRVHVVVTGIEKVVPRLNDAAHLLRLLARSGTGQRLTAYTTFIQGPRQRAGMEEPTGPDEVHVVMVDNGRRAMLRDPHLREALFCLRCGACSNICPVYSHAGGHNYRAIYSGPIGSVWAAALWPHESGARLPFASSLCGACADICPVKIDIHHALLWQRRLATERGALPAWQRWAWRVWRIGMSHALLYRLGSAVARWIGRGVLNRAARAWTATRDLPPLAPKTFRQLWREEP